MARVAVQHEKFLQDRPAPDLPQQEDIAHDLAQEGPTTDLHDDKFRDYPIPVELKQQAKNNDFRSAGTLVQEIVISKRGTIFTKAGQYSCQPLQADLIFDLDEDHIAQNFLHGDANENNQKSQPAKTSAVCHRQTAIHPEKTKRWCIGENFKVVKHLQKMEHLLTPSILLEFCTRCG